MGNHFNLYRIACPRSEANKYKYIKRFHLTSRRGSAEDGRRRLLPSPAKDVLDGSQPPGASGATQKGDTRAFFAGTEKPSNAASPFPFRNTSGRTR